MNSNISKIIIKFKLISSISALTHKASVFFNEIYGHNSGIKSYRGDYTNGKNHYN